MDNELEEKVKKAASLRGESVSEFLRAAAASRVEETLAVSGRERFADVAGAVRSAGGRARRTGAAFTEALAQDRAR